MMGDAGSTILVSGESNASKPERVHTETRIQSKPESKRKVERP